MQYLDEWARKWNISVKALSELSSIMEGNILKNINCEPIALEDRNETERSKFVQLKACMHNARLWRNNVGVAITKNAIIRFGLCNSSKQENQQMKSADLIGIQKMLIKPEHVGSYIGRFISREIKTPRNINKVNAAQFRWMNFINLMGGDAKITIGDF